MGYETEQVVKAAVQIARRAADTFSNEGVLLDIGPSGHAMAPIGDASFDKIYDSVVLQVCAGAADCDGVLLIWPVISEQTVTLAMLWTPCARRKNFCLIKRKCSVSGGEGTLFVFSHENPSEGMYSLTRKTMN